MRSQRSGERRIRDIVKNPSALHDTSREEGVMLQLLRNRHASVTDPQQARTVREGATSAHAGRISEAPINQRVLVVLDPELGAGLIVLVVREGRGWRQWWAGRVEHQIFRRATVPVLAVRRHGQRAA